MKDTMPKGKLLYFAVRCFKLAMERSNRRRRASLKYLRGVLDQQSRSAISHDDSLFSFSAATIIHHMYTFSTLTRRCGRSGSDKKERKKTKNKNRHGRRQVQTLPPPQLPNDCLSNILEFVGPGHFRYIAAVNRTWRDAYTAVVTTVDGNSKGATTTRMGTAVQSVGCARIFLNEASTEELLSVQFHPYLVLASFVRIPRKSGKEELDAACALRALGVAV